MVEYTYVKNTLRSTLTICLIIMVLSTSGFAVGEKSLVRDTGHLAMSYGEGFKISAEEDKQIVNAIKKTGKIDFKEGIYASFRPYEYWGPPSSDIYRSRECGRL